MVFHETADTDDDLGQFGKGFPRKHFIEHLGKFRHDENHQSGGDSSCNGKHEGGIYHGGLDFTLHALRLLHEFRQTVQHGFHGTGCLTGTNHVDIESIKGFRMAGQGFRKRGAAFDRVGQITENFPQRRIVFRLAFQGAQSSHQGQPRIQQSGQLPGRRGQRLAFDFRCGQTGSQSAFRGRGFSAAAAFTARRGCPRPPRRHDAGGEQAHLLQLATGFLLRIRINVALVLFAAGIYSHILEFRHCSILFAECYREFTYFFWRSCCIFWIMPSGSFALVIRSP